MKQDFHLFIRQHVNNWFTASVLTRPEYATFGPSLPALREELADVLAQELGTGALSPSMDEFVGDLERRVLEVELRAVQHERLIRVPMRFSFLQRTLEDDRYEISIPRLQKKFRILGRENIIPWAQEVVRGFFHMADVEKLLRYQYERGERVEPLTVHYNFKKGKKKRGLTYRSKGEELAAFQTPLAQVGVELTEEARQGRVGRALFRETLMDQLIAVLGSSQTRSVLLTGSSGVGKTALVHELSHRIALGQVPVWLREVPVWHVTGGRIIAGMRYLGQWQERCLAIVEEIRNERGVLFADSMVELILSGSNKTGLNVAQFLLPYIQSGEVTVVVESTPDGLILAEQLSSNFVHAFRRVPVPGFSTDAAFRILEISARRLEKEHKVTFTPPSISRALDILARFGDADALPGSGLALIEQMSRLPADDPRRKTAAKLHKRPELTPGDAVAAFSRASGFPETLINPDDLLNVEEVTSFFQERIIGQDSATDLLTNLVTIIKSSLNDPERPLGSFLFMGPTGVGKTETALTLTEYLFGKRERLVRFDMSEYAYPGSAARLVGGAHGAGDLTKRIREQPFCVLLFDEIEKANPEVFDVLLQVLGEGRLTDGTGRTVQFTHAIIIMTSNLGASQKESIGLRGQESTQMRGQELAHHYREAARIFFRPEFINRIDFMIPFHSLGADSVRKIARRMLGSALDREGLSRRNIEVSYREEVLDLLMEHGFEPRYGARPMKRAVEQHVLVPLSRRLVRRAKALEEKFDLYVHNGRVEVISSRGVRGRPVLGVSGLALEHDELWKRFLRDVRLRLQDWEESALLHTLRQESEAAQEGEGASLLLILARTEQTLRRLEELSGQSPSLLEKEAKTELVAVLRELERQLIEVEWALGLRALLGKNPKREVLELELEVPSLKPVGLRYMSTYAEQLERWAQRRGYTFTREEQEQSVAIRIEGFGVQTIVGYECGIHQIQQAEGEVDVLLYRTSERADEQRRVVREIMIDPPTVWHPEAEVEITGSIELLAEHLDRVILILLSAAS